MKSKSILGALFSLLALPLSAQLTTITANSIQGVNLAPLPIGQFCLTPVNANGQPTGFNIGGGGGQVLARQYCWPITSGSIGSNVKVADTSQTTPAIGFVVRTLDAQGVPITTFNQPIRPTGATWSFDAWQPTQTLPILPPITITSGTAAPVGICTAPSLYYTGSSIYTCISGIWTLVNGASGSSFNSLASYNASTLPVTFGSVTLDSNIVNVIDGSSWVNGEGIYIPAVASDAGSPSSGITCDNVTVSGNTITMMNADGSPCNAGWTSSSYSLPIIHFNSTHGSILSGSNSLSVTSAITFLPGQGVRVAGAGASGSDLICPIVKISGTTFTLFASNGTSACNASTTVSAAKVFHDDVTAIKAAIASGKSLYVPNGAYYLSSEIDIPNGTVIYGDGLQSSIFVVDRDAINAVVMKSSGITLRDFGIYASEDFTPTDGTLFSFCDGSSTCFNDNVSRLLLYGGWQSYQLLNKSIQGSFTLVTIHNPAHVAMYLDNPIPYGDINFDGIQAQTCSNPGCTNAIGILIDAADANAWDHIKMNGFAHNLSITGSLGEVDHQRFSNVSFEGDGNTPTGGYINEIQKLGSYPVTGIQFTGGEFEINQTNASGFYIGPGVQGVSFSGIQMWGEGSAAMSTSCIDIAGSMVGIGAVSDISECGDAVHLESTANGVTITGSLIYNNTGWGINSPNGATNLSQATNVFSGNTLGNVNTASSIVANWLMNEGSGTTFTSTVAGNDATTSNVSYTTSAGFPGSVASFNGTTSEATAATATPTSFTNTQAFSACVWINATSFANASTTLLRNLQGGSTANGWQLTVASGGVLGFFIINNAGTGNYINVNASSPVSTGSIHQICATYSGSGTASGTALYIDGSLQSLVVATDALNGSSASTQPLLIGWDGIDTSYTFNGVMGDVEIWDVTLTSSQVASVYATGAQ